MRNQVFFLPAGIRPKLHKPTETTEIMLLMVANGRGVAALPRWVVEDYARKFDVFPARLGENGIAKKIFLGFRDVDADIEYLQAFVTMALEYNEEKSSAA